MGPGVVRVRRNLIGDARARIVGGEGDGSDASIGPRRARRRRPGKLPWLVPVTYLAKFPWPITDPYRLTLAHSSSAIPSCHPSCNIPPCKVDTVQKAGIKNFQL